jgi:hypothetical protein
MRTNEDLLTLARLVDFGDLTFYLAGSFWRRKIFPVTTIGQAEPNSRAEFADLFRNTRMGGLNAEGDDPPLKGDPSRAVDENRFALPHQRAS